jgi:uncharacterized protein (TIGR02996 family)
MDKAFLQAMAEAPDDPSPRLIYADWLEEQGRNEEALFWRQHSLADLVRMLCDGMAGAWQLIGLVLTRMEAFRLIGLALTRMIRRDL